MLRVLSSTPALVVSGLLMMVAGIAIEVMRAGTNGILLDFQMTGAAAITALDQLKSIPNAVGIHIYISATADMLYPLSYGLFGAGLISRLAKQPRWLLASPILLAALFDVIENSVQIIALTGMPDALMWKTFVTPTKFALAGLAIAIVLALAGRRIFYSDKAL